MTSQSPAATDGEANSTISGHSSERGPSRGTGTYSSLQTRLARVFAIDVRALAALRMGLVAVLLFDLASRLRFLSVCYTNAGIKPMTGSPGLCIHAWSDGIAYEALVFCIAAISASLLLVGLFTR